MSSHPKKCRSSVVFNIFVLSYQKKLGANKKGAIIQNQKSSKTPNTIPVKVEMTDSILNLKNIYLHLGRSPPLLSENWVLKFYIIVREYKF